MLSLVEGLSTADSNSAPAKEIMELFGLLYQQSIITLLYLTRQLETQMVDKTFINKKQLGIPFPDEIPEGSLY